MSRFILPCKYVLVILAGAATYGGCYSPLTKEQLTAAEAKQEVELGDYAPWMAS
ncbi:MAG TPA: hypothetical protein GXX19_07010 [Syntrophomonadaceae bacterium]|nr:hypothetical protein [Syntrophomonadaceae bacterium]